MRRANPLPWQRRYAIIKKDSKEVDTVKKWLLLPLLLLMLLILLLPQAQAGAGRSGRELEGALVRLPWEDGGAEAAFTEWKKPEQYGDAAWPVYAAPFDGAWQAEGGKAALHPQDSFHVLAALVDSEWSLVDYALPGGARRVGWCRLPDAFRGGGRPSSLWVSRMLLRVTLDTAMTDDPYGLQGAVCEAKAGSTVIGMGVVRGADRVPWVWAETEADGRTAWLFLPLDAVEEIPVVRMEGNTITVADGVTALGEEMCVNSAGSDWYPYVSQAQVIHPGDLLADISEIVPYTGPACSVRLELPDSIRSIGAEALSVMNLEELRVPASFEEADYDALYGSTVGRLVIPAGCTGDLDSLIKDSGRAAFGEFVVEEGNPRYRAVDGVLFSADGKVLIAWPGLRECEHYDVPAGTEEIADHAFPRDSGAMLRTISLPIGLKKIGDYAFSGCPWLQSMTVPLTVTEMAETAFDSCVSLERLSLPPGLRAELGTWSEANDFTHFNGDNAPSTAPSGGEPSWDWPDETDDNTRLYITARIDTPDGTGSAPIYLHPLTKVPRGELPCGTVETFVGMENGRLKVSEYRYFEEGDPYANTAFWVPLESLLPVTGDVLFSVSGARIREGVKTHDWAAPLRPEAWQSNEARFSESGCVTCSFSPVPGIATEAEANLTDWLTLEQREVELFRPHTGDSRTLGLLEAEDNLSPVFFRDAPEGNVTGHLYTGEQAEVLEARGGWLRVWTSRMEGWIPESCFHPVPQEET